MSSKVPPDFDQWKELNAKLENSYALWERIMNLAENKGTQMLTDEEQRLKNDIPSIEKKLKQEIPALQEEIKNVENKINGKTGWKNWFKTEKKKLKKAKEKKYPAKKKKKEEIQMVDFGKKGKKEPPYASLHPLSGLGLAGLALQEKLRFKGKPQSTTLTGPPYSYKGQEKLQEYATSLPDKKTAALPVDTRHQPPMKEYRYPSGFHQTSDDFGDNTKFLGGKRRKKKSRRRRTKKKKRRRKKKTRKKRKKRKRRRTKKN